MSAPVTVAVMLCPICKDVWTPARATFRWPLSEHGRMPVLIGYDCPNGCRLDDADSDEAGTE
jgi:hypothetical protein